MTRFPQIIRYAGLRYEKHAARIAMAQRQVGLALVGVALDAIDYMCIY